MKILALLLLAVAVTARPQVPHHAVDVQGQVENQDHFRQVQVDEAVEEESPVLEEQNEEQEPQRTNVKPVVAVPLPARVPDRENRNRRQVPPRVPSQVQPQTFSAPERKGSSKEGSQEAEEQDQVQIQTFNAPQERQGSSVEDTQDFGHEEYKVQIQERPTRQAVEVQNKPFPLPEILPEEQPQEQDPNFKPPQVAQEFPIQPEQAQTQDRFTRQTVPVAVQQPEQQQFEVQQNVQREEIVVPQHVNPVPQQFEQQAPQHFSTQQFEQQIAQQQFEVERQQVVPEQVAPQQFGFQQVVPQQFEQPQVVFQQEQQVVPQQFDVRQEANRPQIAQEFPVEFDPATGTLVQPQQPQQPQVVVQGQEPVLQQQPEQQQFQN